MSAGIGIKSNNQILSDAYYGVTKTIKESPLNSLATELMIGVPITTAILTAPKWGKYAKLPYSAWKNKRNLNISYSQGFDTALNKIKQDNLAKKAAKTKTSIWQTLQTGNRKTSALKLAKTGLKGCGIMAVIGGLMEIPNLISASEIDKTEKSGNKYLVKQAKQSAVKVGTGILGYAAGSAATGALVGSICPGIGNIAGGILGFVGGCIGGCIAKMVSDELVGDKTEAELYAQNTATKTADEVAKNADESTEVQAELLTAMKDKIDKGEITSQEVINAYKEQVEKYNNPQQTPSTVDYSNELNLLNTLIVKAA